MHIAAAEARVRVHDKSDITYPWAAKVMSDRRDNPQRTITSLQERLQAQQRSAINPA